MLIYILCEDPPERKDCSVGGVFPLDAGHLGRPQGEEREGCMCLAEIWGGLGVPDADNGSHSGNINLMHFNKKTERKKPSEDPPLITWKMQEGELFVQGVP